MSTADFLTLNGFWSYPGALEFVFKQFYQEKLITSQNTSTCSMQTLKRSPTLCFPVSLSMMSLTANMTCIECSRSQSNQPTYSTPNFLTDGQVDV